MRGNYKLTWSNQKRSLKSYSFVLEESGFFLLTETSLMVFSFLFPLPACLVKQHTVVLFRSVLSELWIASVAVAGVCRARCCVVRRGAALGCVLAVHWLQEQPVKGGWGVTGSLTGDWRREWSNLSDSLMKNNLKRDARIQKVAALTLFPVYRRSKGSVPSGLWFVLCILVLLFQLPAGISWVPY